MKKFNSFNKGILSVLVFTLVFLQIPNLSFASSLINQINNTLHQQNSGSSSGGSGSSCTGSCGSSSSSSSTSSSSSSGGSLINQINNTLHEQRETCSGSACGSSSTSSTTSTTTPRTTTTTTTTTTPQNLETDCRVSATRIYAGDTITFTANISGGRSPYHINWFGDVNRISGFDRTRQSQTLRINNPGTYYIDLEVTDRDGRRRTGFCPMIVVEEERTRVTDLDVQCELSRSTITAGSLVDIGVYISGGNPTYEIEWSGDARYISGLDRFIYHTRNRTTTETQRVRINTAGTYRLRVDVEDRDGNRGTDYCTLRVTGSSASPDITVRTGSTAPDGELAGLSSVFLNQVPHTGPEDILKVVGFIAMAAVWSFVVAYYFLKDKKKKDFSTKIQEFKKTNQVKITTE